MTADDATATPADYGSRQRPRPPARPDRRSPTRRTASASPSTSTARASRRSCSCPRRRSSTRASGRARSRTSAGSYRVVDLRRARQRPVGPPDRPRRLHATTGSSATSRPCMDATGTDARRPRRACAATASGGRSSSRRRSRSASRASSRSRAGVPLLVAAPPVAGRVLVRRRAADRRGLGEAQPPLLARATTRASRASSSRRSRPSRIRPRSIDDAVGVGARRVGRRDARRHATPPSDRDREARRGDLSRRDAARCCSSTARRTTASRSPRSRALAELTGAPLVVVEGADHMIPAATRCSPTC